MSRANKSLVGKRFHVCSPNRMVHQYFQALRRLVSRVLKPDDVSIQKQDIALCTFMGVTVVETFLNVFFRVTVSEEGRRHHEKGFLDDLANQCTLDHKIKKWPRKILGQEIDLKTGIGRDFMCLKSKRNALMHFTSSHETLNLGGLTIKGLANTSTFDELVPDNAVFALNTAEGIIALILRMNGATDQQLPWGIQLWTGKVPLES